MEGKEEEGKGEEEEEEEEEEFGEVPVMGAGAGAAGPDADSDAPGGGAGASAGGVGDGSDEKVEKKVKKPSATPVSDFEAKEKKKGVVRGCLSAACVPRPASVWRRLLSYCTV